MPVRCVYTIADWMLQKCAVLLNLVMVGANGDTGVTMSNCIYVEDYRGFYGINGNRE